LTRAASPPPPEEPLIRRFNRYFEVVSANTPELRQQAHAIRYHVYCLETGFENPGQNPGGVEKDTYDSHSVHGLIIHRRSRMAVGTTRLVLPLADNLENSFAVQSVTKEPAAKASTLFPLATTAEISRFCISRQFRRRVNDTLYDQPGTEPTVPDDPAERRNGPLMRLGLMQAIVRMSMEHGMTHWCAVMEPTLLRMIEAMGIRFNRLGPPVEYHGLRQPCWASIEQVLNRLKRERPDFWDVYTCSGTFTL
jgi:N-acyl amino acid synthase of PEP-CTERM/exosortase system